MASLVLRDHMGFPALESLDLRVSQEKLGQRACQGITVRVGSEVNQVPEAFQGSPVFQGLPVYL